MKSASVLIKQTPSSYAARGLVSGAPRERAVAAAGCTASRVASAASSSLTLCSLWPAPEPAAPSPKPQALAPSHRRGLGVGAEKLFCSLFLSCWTPFPSYIFRQGTVKVTEAELPPIYPLGALPSLSSYTAPFSLPPLRRVWSPETCRDLCFLDDPLAIPDRVVCFILTSPGSKLSAFLQRYLRTRPLTWIQ